MQRMALVSMMAIVPAVSFAQSSSNNNGPVTRAQVIQELIDLESVGYHPASANDATYPDDAQSAMRRLAAKRADEARLAQERQQQEPAAQSGYGAPPAPSGESGAPAVVSGGATPSVYRHH
ncbi:DUF4148 domain-containing protein [Paraburkholderia lycopersici]|nr:DUF4148 domain-containing protein [Paraburkholderia lycopersici]